MIQPEQMMMAQKILYFVFLLLSRPISNMKNIKYTRWIRSIFTNILANNIIVTHSLKLCWIHTLFIHLTRDLYRSIFLSRFDFFLYLILLQSIPSQLSTVSYSSSSSSSCSYFFFKRSISLPVWRSLRYNSRLLIIRRQKLSRSKMIPKALLYSAVLKSIFLKLLDVKL